LIRVYRICDRRYARSAYSGEGARLYGGRWNPVGLPMVYTSGSISLAILENLVNIQDLEDLPGKLVLIPADLPNDLPLRRVDSQSLPSQWRSFAISSITQALGKRWFLEEGEAVVAVPSVVVPTEINYLINPRHAGFSRIIVHKPQPLQIDPRLLGTL
jgi:RES domain-containing protein